MDASLHTGIYLEGHVSAQSESSTTVTKEGMEMFAKGKSPSHVLTLQMLVRTCGTRQWLLPDADFMNH